MATFSIGSPPTPQSLETLAWSGWPESHLTLLPPEPLPRRPPKPGGFSRGFSRWDLALPSNCFRTPPKNPCKNPCKYLCKQSLQIIPANNPHRNPHKKKSGRQSVQKICAENLCRKSIQKSAQKNCAKQTRANGFPKVTLRSEKPIISSSLLSRPTKNPQRHHFSCVFWSSCLSISANSRRRNARQVCKNIVQELNPTVFVREVGGLGKEGWHLCAGLFPAQSPQLSAVPLVCFVNVPTQRCPQRCPLRRPLRCPLGRVY